MKRRTSLWGRRSKPLSLLMLVGLTAALVVPTGGVAQANHLDDSCIDLTPEDSTRAVGTEHTLTATLRDGDQDACTGDPNDPHDPLRVKFEFEGANDPDNSTSFGTADRTCTIGDESTSCTMTYTGSDAGEDEITGWLDLDNDNNLDASEPRDEVDITWTTSTTSPPLLLDCDDPSGNDTHTIDAGDSIIYSCILTAPDDNDSDNERERVPNTRIDAENLDGANDPDSSDNAGSPDYNNICTTNSQGTCFATIDPDDDDDGVAELCFWADTDNDSVFSPSGAQNDGGGCNSESVATENDDAIDVVSVTWVEVDARTIDCEPETDLVNMGETHVVVCELETSGGDEVEGEEVQFTEAGPGEIVSDDDDVSDEDGEVSVTVESEVEPGTQTIVATIVDDLTNEPDTDECDREEDDPDDAPEGVCSDSVLVDWQQVPEQCVGISNAIVGTEGDDRIEGTSGTDFICALGGDDIVDGGGGNDLILLGPGNDAAFGGGGSDRIHGQGGADFIRGGTDTDLLVGGRGRDVIRGNGDNDLIRGNAGGDALFGNAGSDRLNGGRGADRLDGGRGTDLLKAGPGFDTCLDARRTNILRSCER